MSCRCRCLAVEVGFNGPYVYALCPIRLVVVSSPFLVAVAAGIASHQTMCPPAPVARPHTTCPAAHVAYARAAYRATHPRPWMLEQEVDRKRFHLIRPMIRERKAKSKNSSWKCGFWPDLTN
ncbi:Ureidoglycolate hydrolase [Zea mays]|jgi:hypothetical protein|uniref:Ureidoglycolate hydrolase n=1 Tax=Zea mays TaxID=4577 RepID=A0A1D6KFD6_MAIZE|nr:Ureidoglycolate hydrolase [Zea mays]